METKQISILGGVLVLSVFGFLFRDELFGAKPLVASIIEIESEPKIVEAPKGKVQKAFQKPVEEKLDVIEPKPAESTDNKKYIQTSGWTPVFGDPDIAKTLQMPGLDRDGAVQLWRDTPDDWFPSEALHFVAFPQTIFEITESVDENIWAVKCVNCEYNLDTLYIAPAEYEIFETLPKWQKPKWPTTAEIIKKIKEYSTAEINYGWGGNAPAGVRFNLHESFGEIVDYGLDCSGILYLATGGLTPRNTEDLVEFGRGVDIEGQSITQILGKLEPLDLIVWKGGHMMIVMPGGKIVESRYSGPGSELPSGLNQRDLAVVLESVMQTRTPVNIYPDDAESSVFVVRRIVWN